MQKNFRKFLLATCCLTLTACGGTGIDGPTFGLGAGSPAVPDNGDNAAPTDITMTDLKVTENSTGGASSIVGNVTVADPDVGDSFTITVDDSRFAYDADSGNLVLVNGTSLNFETTPTIDVTLTATDANGASLSKIFTVEVGNIYEQVATESRTYSANSVAMDIISHRDFNNRSLFPFADPGVDPSELVAGTETNPTHEGLGGTSTIHYDTSDQSFSLTVKQGNVDFFHNFREAEDRDVTVTDALRYESIVDAAGALYILDITKPGVARNGLSLDYLSFGMWSAQAYPIPVAGWRDTFGGVAFGEETQNEDMPTTGTASYTGLTVGYMEDHYETEILDQESFDEALATNPSADPDDFLIEVDYHRSFSLEGDVSITANFDAQTLNAFMNNMMRTDVETGVTSPWFDFHSSLALTPGSNSFSGTTSTNVPFLHGHMKGTFYGPVTGTGPSEIGGVWSLFDAADQDFRAVGSFGATRD